VPQLALTIANKLLDAVPLCAYQAFIRREPIGLLYHAVGADPRPHLRHLYAYKTPSQFTRDLEYVAKNFDVCSVRDLGSCKRLKPRVYITFDDGLAECYDVVRDILLKKGLPAAFFITTGVLDNRSLMYAHKKSLCVDAVSNNPAANVQNRLAEFGHTRFGRPFDRHGFLTWMKALRRSEVAPIDDACAFFDVDVEGFLDEQRPYMTAEQVCRLASDGFDIGSHTVTHPGLSEIPISEAEAEIEESSRFVANLLGAKAVSFAFPFSSDGVDSRWIEQLRAKLPLLHSFFDATGLTVNSSVFNRISADAPPSHGENTNLPLLLHGAYKKETKRVADYRRSSPRYQLAPRTAEPRVWKNENAVQC
jgi:peptidoglycan/xylan/chitin deacetylase (PgdA/CDA1 family)